MPGPEAAEQYVILTINYEYGAEVQNAFRSLPAEGDVIPITVNARVMSVEPAGQSTPAKVIVQVDRRIVEAR